MLQAAVAVTMRLVISTSRLTPAATISLAPAGLEGNSRMDRDDDLGSVLDGLIADAFTMSAFMIQVSLELAKQQERPEKRAAASIANLHSRTDGGQGCLRMCPPLMPVWSVTNSLPYNASR